MSRRGQATKSISMESNCRPKSHLIMSQYYAYLGRKEGCVFRAKQPNNRLADCCSCLLRLYGSWRNDTLKNHQQSPQKGTKSCNYLFILWVSSIIVVGRKKGTHISTTKKVLKKIASKHRVKPGLSCDDFGASRANMLFLPGGQSWSQAEARVWRSWSILVPPCTVTWDEAKKTLHRRASTGNQVKHLEFFCIKLCPNLQPRSLDVTINPNLKMNKAVSSENDRKLDAFWGMRGCPPCQLVALEMVLWIFTRVKNQKNFRSNASVSQYKTMLVCNMNTNMLRSIKTKIQRLWIC